MPTILLADDNDDSREIYRAFFEDAGHRVLEAESGLVVLERLRARPHTEDIPCLVFTGDARFEALGKAVHRGADAFLTKPAEPRAVLQFVEELLRERGHGEGPAARG